jgi:hypothetical protein
MGEMNDETPRRKNFVGLADQVEVVKREIRLRKRVYPNRVMTKRMSQKMADYQIDAMEQVLETVEAAYAQQQKDRSLF